MKQRVLVSATLLIACLAGGAQAGEAPCPRIEVFVAAKGDTPGVPDLLAELSKGNRDAGGADYEWLPIPLPEDWCTEPKLRAAFDRDLLDFFRGYYGLVVGKDKDQVCVLVRTGDDARFTFLDEKTNSIERASLIMNEQPQSSGIFLSLPPEAAKLFTQYTTRHVGEAVAVVMNDAVLGTPRIATPLSIGIVPVPNDAERANKMLMEITRCMQR